MRSRSVRLQRSSGSPAASPRSAGLVASDWSFQRCGLHSSMNRRLVVPLRHCRIQHRHLDFIDDQQRLAVASVRTTSPTKPVWLRPTDRATPQVISPARGHRRNAPAKAELERWACRDRLALASRSPTGGSQCLQRDIHHHRVQHELHETRSGRCG